MPRILPDIQGDAIFFLDGHWSSKNTGRGPKDVPLFEELEAINTLFRGKALLIIDDYRLFGRYPQALFKFKYHTENWRYITKPNLISRIKERTTYNFVHNDRFSICIREK